MDENTASSENKNNNAGQKSKYDSYLERLEKWRADHKKEKAKPAVKPLCAKQTVNQLPVKSNTFNKSNASSLNKRTDTRRATQEITRTQTKRQDPRRRTQEVFRNTVAEPADERRLTQHRRISNIVSKPNLKGTTVNKPGLSSIQNTKKSRWQNEGVPRRATICPGSVNPRRLTQPVAHPRVQNVEKKRADPPSKLRRLTQDVVRPISKRNDPRRMTQPIKTTFTHKSNGSAAAKKSCDDKTKETAPELMMQDAEHKESPDLRQKLEEWRIKKHTAKAGGPRSTSKLPRNKTPSKLAVERRKTYSAFPSSTTVKRCDQPKGACKAKVDTKRHLVQSLTNDKVTHRRSMLPSTRPNPKAAASVKRSRSVGSVQDSHVNKKTDMALNHTPGCKNVNKCPNSTVRKQALLPSSQIESVRRSPRTAGSRVRHVSASVAVQSAATGRHRTISGCHVANPADPGKVKGRKSILKHWLTEETVQGHVKVMEEEDRKVKVTFRSPALNTPQQKPLLPRTPSSKSQKEISMRSRLDAWLTARGKTPSRFQHLRCFGVELSAKKKKLEQPILFSPGLSTHELEHQQDCLAEESSESIVDSPPATTEDPIQAQLRQLLNECHALFEAGCPSSNITSWLDEIQGNIPAAMRTAEYWVCRAHIAEEMEDNNLAVDLFEQAVLHKATPASELAEALMAFVMRMEDHKKAVSRAAHTPGHPRLPSGMSEDNVFESCSIRYCVSNDTPLMKRLNPPDGKSTPRVVVTPVRRSTRRSTSTLPSMLQDHDVIVESLEEVADPSALFQANRALEKDFEEAAEENV